MRWHAPMCTSRSLRKPLNHASVISCGQVCIELVKAGQWATVLDTLRRAAALPGVQIANKRLGLNLLRAAVRTGAGNAALLCCLHVAPPQEAMHVVLLHHYRAARNLEVCTQTLGPVHMRAS